MQGSRFKDYLHLHLIVFIWGFTAILGALISIDAIPLVWYRMFLASAFIALYFVIRRKSFQIDRKSLVKFVFTGILIALHWITFFNAIKVSNVSVALVTMSTGAFFTSFIEPIFFKRRIRLIEIILGAMVVGGLAIIFTFESQYTWGIIYALISAFLSAIFSVLNGLFIKKNEAGVISFYQLFFGAMFITGYLLVIGEMTLDFFVLSVTDWYYLLILSSICTAYAFIASIKVMRSLTPYTVMLTINLEPIYAIILALIIFGEKEEMNSEFYLGAFIVLFVVLLNGLLKNMKKIVKKSVKKSG
jgi:drug/metabolite transporter (DMT)-like permease